jgi:hypothetical protein
VKMRVSMGRQSASSARTWRSRNNSSPGGQYSTRRAALPPQPGPGVASHGAVAVTGEDICIVRLASGLGRSDYHSTYVVIVKKARAATWNPAPGVASRTMAGNKRLPTSERMVSVPMFTQPSCSKTVFSLR